MKIELSFDTSDYEEKKEALRAVKATEAYVALHGVFDSFRKRIKYDTTLTENELKLLEDLRDEISRNLTDLGIDLDNEL